MRQFPRRQRACVGAWVRMILQRSVQYKTPSVDSSARDSYFCCRGTAREHFEVIVPACGDIGKAWDHRVSWRKIRPP